MKGEVWIDFVKPKTQTDPLQKKSFYLPVACKTPCESVGYARGGGWVVKF